MFRHNFITYSGKIFAQVIMEIIYFPLWWYSVGFSRLIKGVFKFWRDQEQSLGFGVWAKNIFVPMYGQYDWPGRIISFLIRVVQIIARGLVLLFWFVILLAFSIIWLFFPIALLLVIMFQISRQPL